MQSIRRGPNHQQKGHMGENWPPPACFSCPHYSSAILNSTFIPQQQLWYLNNNSIHQDPLDGPPGLAHVIRNTEAQVLERVRGLESRQTNTAMLTRQRRPLSCSSPSLLLYLVTCFFIIWGLLPNTISSCLHSLHLSPPLDRKSCEVRGVCLMHLHSLEPSPVPRAECIIYEYDYITEYYCPSTLLL